MQTQQNKKITKAGTGATQEKDLFDDPKFKKLVKESKGDYQAAVQSFLTRCSGRGGNDYAELIDDEQVEELWDELDEDEEFGKLMERIEAKQTEKEAQEALNPCCTICSLPMKDGTQY